MWQCQTRIRRAIKLSWSHTTSGGLMQHALVITEDAQDLAGPEGRAACVVSKGDGLPSRRLLCQASHRCWNSSD